MVAEAGSFIHCHDFGLEKDEVDEKNKRTIRDFVAG